ncbi:hypothetical protein [Mammaliicoccus vitulinus]|uniref:hypothetical protein n=1 Tax=Mammaliicoccus vitulinus TaxID=71237 RepID=UPI0028D38A86|nr:hypothetical protein [Mammaliicoccus vitulinus]
MIQVEKIIVEGNEYILTPKHLRMAEENNFDKTFIRMRIRAGWSLDLAVKVPQGVPKCDAESYLKFEELDGRKRKPKKDYSKPKPWLKKYPQKTKFGDYAQQLFKDCCGSWAK